MFAHIRKLHNTELLKNTSKKWLDEAEAGEPLKVWWETKNDFDEDELTILYVCLSTNKTFTVEAKAQQHFAKDKAALKDHNKQLKQLQKEYALMRKQEAKKQKEKEKLYKKTDPFQIRFQQAKETNDPELIRSLWIGIFHHKRCIDLAQLLTERRGYTDNTMMYLHIRNTRNYMEVTYKDFLEVQKQLLNDIDEAYNEKCMDYRNLSSLWSRAWNLWASSYKESYMNLNEDLAVFYPTFNSGWAEQFFYFATEEMEKPALWF